LKKFNLNQQINGLFDIVEKALTNIKQ